MPMSPNTEIANFEPSRSVRAVGVHSGSRGAIAIMGIFSSEPSDSTLQWIAGAGKAAALLPDASHGHWWRAEFRAAPEQKRCANVRDGCSSDSRRLPERALYLRSVARDAFLPWPTRGVAWQRMCSCS